jgi:hypothetical protein
VDLLSELFGSLAREDKHIAAACLIALQRAGGEAAVEELLQKASDSKRQRLLALVTRENRREGQMVILFRLAAEIESLLPEDDNDQAIQ